MLSNKIFSVLVIIVFIITLLFSPASACPKTQHSIPLIQDSSQEERTLKNITPPRVPVTMTDVRNLQNEHWLRELEIEIRNDSNRPIYFLLMALHFPDIPKTTEYDGKERGIVVVLSYGRFELAKSAQRPTPEDISIGPGQTYVFKVDEPSWKGFEDVLSRRNLEGSTTKRVRLFIQTMRFDDGTGYVAGSPSPRN